MASPLSREFLLAAACSIWPPSERRTNAVCEAARGPLDWDRFLRVVARHRIVGLVHNALTSARPPVPPRFAHEIGVQAATLVRKNLAIAAEAVQLQQLFDEAKLPALFIKGVSLSKLAYGNLGIRESKDLDLLVSIESLKAANTLLERAGYRRLEPPFRLNNAQMRLLLSIRKDVGYIHESNGIEVELHWRLFSNPHFMAETTTFALSRVMPITTTMGLRTLGEDDLFAYLCAHGALHWWHQLKWLADIGASLEGAPESEIQRLYRAAEARGVGRAAAQAFLLCERLLGTRVPNQLITTLRARSTVRWLEATALQALSGAHGEIEPAGLTFGTTRGSLSCFLLSRNWRYRFAEIKILLTCQRDVLTISLPKWLQFLYPILRLPFWLWRHSTHRDRYTR